MIEKMKKVTVICLEREREQSLTALRDFGAMHVVQSTKYQSECLSDAIDERDKLQSVLVRLHGSHSTSEPERKFPEYETMSTDQLLNECWEAIHNITWYEENMVNHQRMAEALEPWGKFDGKLVEKLRAKGMDVRFCQCGEKDMPEFPDDLLVHEAARDKGKVWFLVVSPKPIELELPQMHVHTETSLEELVERDENSNKAIAFEQGKLQALSNYLAKFEEEMHRAQEKVEFLANRDGMGKEASLSYIQGYIPAKHEEKLNAQAPAHGWALVTEDADPEDPKVPTKLKIPKIFELVKPLFSFLGIVPGYNETDVSISLLLFLTLFFGMLIGDAGYGTLFLIIAFIAKVKVKNPQARLPLNLFILMSATTVVWGALGGNWFGISSAYENSGLDWVKDESNGKWFCFLLAAIHLSMARIWRAVIFMKYPLKMLANIGWALFLWGNFFIAAHLVVGNAFPGFAKWLLIVGGALVVLFDINWKDIGSIINAPFAFIGSFVDTLSYIRLFAVGLASYSIAVSFNAMAMGMMKEGGLSMILAVLVMVLGHALNIVLGFMGVLVHGVRLNTLEFSNHMEITWGGMFFNPFKKKN